MKTTILLGLIFHFALMVVSKAAVQAETPKPLQHGKASWYHEPQRLASGGHFNPNEMTAAHRTLPFGTMVKVTNLRSNRSAIVRINDRGPYGRNRIIDLSRAAAKELAMINSGTAPVSLEILSSR